MHNKKILLVLIIFLVASITISCNVKKDENVSTVNETLQETLTEEKTNSSIPINKNVDFLLGYNKNGFKIDERYNDLAKLEIQSNTTLDSELKKVIRSEFTYNYNSRIIADMMSERVIKTVQDIMKTSDEDFVQSLGKFNNDNFRHGTFVVRELNDKDDLINYWFTSDDLDDSSKPIDYSSMVGLQNRFEKIVGMCSDFATFNASALRLYGKSPEDVAVLHIPGHAILSFEHNDEDYLFDNEYLLKRNSNSNIYTSINKKSLFFKYKQDFSSPTHDYKKIYSIYNDVFNYKPNYDNEISSNALAGVYDRLNIEYTKNDLDYIYSNYLNEKVSLDKSYEDISIENMNKVYKLGLEPNNQKYNIAKYRYRTLLVKNPEYYLRAHMYEQPGQTRIKSLMFRFFIRELQNIESAIEYVKNLNDSSIYLESHRVMDPEQILVFNQADSKSKAMFLYMIAEELKKDALIIYSDKNSYVVISDNNNSEIYRLDTCETTKSIEGNVTLILNKDEVYYPFMKRYDLKDETKSLLNQYNIMIESNK